MRHRIGMLVTMLCVASLCAACGGNNILTLSDTGPANIDVNVSLSLGNGAGNHLDITMLQNKTWVAMNHGETMICNDISIGLDPDHIGFTASDFPLDTPTTPITCVYHSGTHTGNFTITPTDAPQIISPVADATVALAQPLTVTYGAGPGVRVQASAHDVQVFKGEKSGSNNAIDKPDNGSITLDVRGLTPGQGFIQVTRFVDVHPVGTGFRSFEGGFDTTTILNVTWV